MVQKLLNIPEYKVKEIISITDKEIHIRLEAYKRKKLVYAVLIDASKTWHGVKMISLRYFKSLQD